MPRSLGRSRPPSPPEDPARPYLTDPGIHFESHWSNIHIASVWTDLSYMVLSSRDESGPVGATKAASLGPMQALLGSPCTETPCVGSQGLFSSLIPNALRLGLYFGKRNPSLKLQCVWKESLIHFINTNSRGNHLFHLVLGVLKMSGTKVILNSFLSKSLPLFSPSYIYWEIGPPPQSPLSCLYIIICIGLVS